MGYSGPFGSLRVNAAPITSLARGIASGQITKSNLTFLYAFKEDSLRGDEEAKTSGSSLCILKSKDLCGDVDVSRVGSSDPDPKAWIRC